MTDHPDHPDHLDGPAVALDAAGLAWLYAIAVTGADPRTVTATIRPESGGALATHVGTTALLRAVVDGPLRWALNTIAAHDGADTVRGLLRGALDAELDARGDTA